MFSLTPGVPPNTPTLLASSGGAPSPSGVTATKPTGKMIAQAKQDAQKMALSREEEEEEAMTLVRQEEEASNLSGRRKQWRVGRRGR